MAQINIYIKSVPTRWHKKCSKLINFEFNDELRHRFINAFIGSIILKDNFVLKLLDGFKFEFNEYKWVNQHYERNFRLIKNWMFFNCECFCDNNVYLNYTVIYLFEKENKKTFGHLRFDRFSWQLASKIWNKKDQQHNKYRK